MDIFPFSTRGSISGMSNDSDNLNTPRRTLFPNIDKATYMSMMLGPVYQKYPNTSPEEMSGYYAYYDEKFLEFQTSPNELNSPPGFLLRGVDPSLNPGAVGSSLSTSGASLAPHGIPTWANSTPFVPQPPPPHSGQIINYYMPSEKIPEADLRIPELNVNASVQSFLNWQQHVLDALSLTPHFVPEMMTKPRNVIDFGQTPSDTTSKTYKLVWLRLQRAITQLNAKITAISSVAPYNLHLLWMALREHFLPTTEIEIHSRISTFRSLRQGDKDVTTFVNEVMMEAYILQQLGMPQTTSDIKAQILNHLTDRDIALHMQRNLSTTIDEWLKDLLTMDRFLKGSSARKVEIPKTESVMAVTTTNGFVCHYCNAPGHRQFECPLKPKNKGAPKGNKYHGPRRNDENRNQSSNNGESSQYSNNKYGPGSTGNKYNNKKRKFDNKYNPDDKRNRSDSANDTPSESSTTEVPAVKSTMARVPRRKRC